MTALPCNLPLIVRQFIVGSRRPCAFGYTEFCGGRISVKAQLIKGGFPSPGHRRTSRSPCTRHSTLTGLCSAVPYPIVEKLIWLSDHFAI